MRSAFKAVRLLAKYHKLAKTSCKHFRQPGFIMLTETGHFSCFSGSGDFLQSFMKNRVIKNYLGESSPIMKGKEVGFGKSKLRFMPFDSTFIFLPTDVNGR